MLGMLAGSAYTARPQIRIQAHVSRCGPPRSSILTLWLGCRDVPYGFDFLAENVMDPSHVAHSHHGVLGHRQNVGPKSSGLPNSDYECAMHQSLAASNPNVQLQGS